MPAMHSDTEANRPPAGSHAASAGYAGQPVWKLSFLGLLRHLYARRPELPQVGQASRPHQEPFRVGQAASLSFAPREIAQLEQSPAGLQVQLFGLGMLGPNGPLPLHFTEIVRDRAESRRDRTTAAFLDIFHHRALTQFYQAWAVGQAAAGLDRPDDEVFSRYVGWLAGHEAEEIAHSPLPAHARLAASAHHVREARNPDGIADSLAHFFGVPVRLEEYVLHWIAIDPADLTCLGHAGPSGLLAHGAMLGDSVPDRQHKFRLVIGPLGLRQYLRFAPNGRDLPVLVEWVRSFVGFEFAWEAELQVKPASAPPAILGAQERLGWSTWLGEPDPRRAAVTGMVFEPELYMRG
ncbi:type VI secretion system baseplate subunit TssG [Cupriavidus basilensis]|uniref:Type VI secretion system baseplate subunit TssG n=2 Tax=Cupriavidus basilensis TaxID=68895 RepID=A0ABT6AWH0_9BURK|nr:type VI secretion system baseplate subunit TssG [Cupriavidus basilensis]MDF3836978.1 type VI secretion system baseplate subunit TssG [Cupriavidus basilensis]